MSDDDFGGAYEDDFDEQLADEFGVEDVDGGLAHVYESEHAKAQALLEAKLSVIGGELARKLDSTIRPQTGSLRASYDPTAFAAARQAAAPASSFSPAVPSSISHMSNAAAAANASAVDSARMRQSQDIFAALDLANTDSALKESYLKYWDAVEEQFKAETRADEELRERRTREAEHKHLARLKAKMAERAREAALARDGSIAGPVTDPHLKRKQKGWDDGFAFERERAAARDHSPRAKQQPPAVIKANAALEKYMSGTAGPTTGAGAAPTTNTTVPAFSSSLLQPTSKKENAASTSNRQASGAGTLNAKPLPPAPSGIVDASRIKKVVQTHMPSIVLAKLAASRRNIAAPARNMMSRTTSAKPVSRKSSAASTRPTGALGRKLSTASTEDEFAEEISPGNKSSAKSSAAPSRATSAALSRTSSTAKVSAGREPASSPTSSATTTQAARPHARAASAGVGAKPTNASMLLAAQRAAQLHAEANPPDTKVVPIAQWNRMKREIDDLRRKVQALELENDALRSKIESSPTPSPPPAATGGNEKPSLSRAQSKSSLTRTASQTAAANRLASSPPPTNPTFAKSNSSAPSAAGNKATGVNLGLKLNLAGLTTDGGPPSTSSAGAMIASAALVSPRVRCAVSGCGQTRMGNKPYCAQHIALHPPTPKSNVPQSNRQASFEQQFSPTKQQPQQPTPKFSSSSPSDASPVSLAPSSRSPPVNQESPQQQQPPPAAGNKFNLGLGFGNATYNYDYESDENFGGTDAEDSMDDSFDGSMEEDEASATAASLQRSHLQHQASTSSSSSRGGGGAASGSQGGSGSSGLSSRQQSYDDEGFADFGEHDGLTARASHRSVVRDATPRQNPVLTSSKSTVVASQQPLLSPSSQPPPDVTRIKSDPVSATYSARDKANIPRPTVPSSSSATPRASVPSTAAPSVVSSSRGVDVRPTGGMFGGLDLESLRNSPYAHIDGLNGSFEITQSGTFKRGGFSLNRQGMISTPTGSSNSAAPSGRDAASATATTSAESHRSFQWSEGGASTTARSTAPVSSRSTLSSAASTPSHANSSSSSVAGGSTGVRSLNVADLYMLGVLGRGSSGTVYRAFHAPTMELLAIKEISIHEKDKRKQLTQELRTLTLQPNPYTIGFRGAYFDDQHIYIALEFMDMGSLDDLLQQSAPDPIPEVQLAFIFEQVLQGLKHLEKMGIIHRDIKPHNILYNERGQFKLTDFGIISDLKDRSESEKLAEAKTFVGTLLYMSPERIGGQSYSFACDIWSMALSLLTCRVGEFAIPHASHWELVNAIQSGPAILNSYDEAQVSDDLRDLLAHCLRANPLERPTAAECLLHPFFSQYRINGPTRPIPMPPNFPPLRTKSVITPTGSPLELADGPSSAYAPGSKEERRAKRAEEVERKNQQHTVEQVCKLIVTRGMTSKRDTSKTSGVTSTPPPLALPLDSKLCERICERLSTLLKAPVSVVRPILVKLHNDFVGL